jgi:biotin synthase-like enzyme
MEMSATSLNETMSQVAIHDANGRWMQAEAQALHDAPFNDLLFRAQTVHSANLDPNRVLLSRLPGINMGLRVSKLMEVDRVFIAARNLLTLLPSCAPLRLPTSIQAA